MYGVDVNMRGGAGNSGHGDGAGDDSHAGLKPNREEKQLVYLRRKKKKTCYETK